MALSEPPARAIRASLIGYILAGGQSSRMGTDKALLTLTGEPGSKTFLAHAVATIRTVAPEAVLLGDRTLLEGAARALPDQHPGCGPIGGIETALTDLIAHHAEWAAFLPVDMPLLPPGLYSALIAHWLTQAASGLRIGLLEIDSRPQPLVSLIHRTALPSIASALAAGRHKITDVLKEAAESLSTPNALGVVSFSTTDPQGESLRQTIQHPLHWTPSKEEWNRRHLWFENLNTPEDLRTARDFFPPPGSETPAAG